MPVIDAKLLLTFHQTGETSEWNLLLLWSMFFVAANCMYDNGGETDKVVLLQSALLMGLWHSQRHSHAQPWYWTGIAISICQILGLHRDPDSVKFNASFPAYRRHLWRRLFWSCFFRDRWLSLTLGRPLRMNLNDCDTPMPSVADVISDLDELPPSIIQGHIPDDLSQLAEYWIVLIRFSKLLGDVLTLGYQPFSPAATLQQVESLEADIQQLQVPDKCANEQNKFALFYLYHLQLHYHTLLITFYNPYMTKVPEDLPLANRQAWRASIRNKIDAVALRANAIIDNIVRDRLVGFAAPMTLNKLELCMMVMEELEETYASASIYRGVFLEVIRQLYPNYSTNTLACEPNMRDPFFSRANAADESTPMPTANDDVLDAFLDEASAMNFWGSFGDIQLGSLVPDYRD
ncbi:hypothetical protein MAC_04965 [Metarhizium acridum CQMa 102]|uniref:Xylanolytic transcriptional activator regulatory domain-containing protein n=1 Tax=Metarhizium acridum (strain CQMa 102) TaxID=655827 RepID=E9E517_METAQ|nr:uncharacterized protein MAC_04965 [Metarhizium acridum CQMa 102]EFY89034.1 hypothetical protein MAC_04965 [Metarhizium acridum CQMa 102]